ncbi:hypothetical protein [Pedobacter hartonius]|uniref:Uncharacterized protein n=1 Tax=Pedobacter hartonius TaxID=425514 RepID=A0A1H3YYG1_9SPHI|nr:hypothetical protein [Pedobacter hartonius]SEA16623.1 hypothetical protein SAMN05443550_102173 [Pedobacter hartonius]
MAEQLTTSAEALRLFFTDDIYLVKNEEATAFSTAAKQESERMTVPESAQKSVLPAPEPLAAPAAVFKYLGKNQKNILILVNDGEHDVSSESGRELLRNLVKAMQLTANDFALLNYFDYQQSKFEDLIKFFSSRLVLGFGVSPVQLGLNEQPQHAIGRHGDIQLVFSGRLDLLTADQEGKKKLWGSLKQLTF